MNKWLALYAVLCITCIIGLVQLGYDYETSGYGLHPVIAGWFIFLIGLGYWLIAKLFTKHAPTPHALLNMRSAQVIDDARSDARYLTNVPLLCGVLSRHRHEKKITKDEYNAAKDAVMESLGGQLFLFAYLKQQGKVTFSDDCTAVVYYNEAHKHWDNLIAQLQS